MTEKLLLLSLSSYAVTLLATSSYIGGLLFREPIVRLSKKIFGSLSPVAADISYFLECRMCSGFWISLTGAYVIDELTLFLPAYALSYFLATQERN